ncbi:MAG: deoxyhypusine synthase [Candidatus Nitrosotenuis sp.]|uniref:Putative deoxyhypusine synthase n=1 Tax=Candidatus Nitrosotenuis uzonensis TaxID=1407055 RepID=A0A812F1H8_9ARCH|nr:deoxyhypusine synthase [Candidatus Nitrosotenuis uzonensis]MCA2003137.1 deoxyhypusine synthase [Candidatus Nitrosotenuis sp.]CAE6501419.1 putative deoxyhypusine synthase [Candidatus Nitrosotenuis uzonensis]
MIEPGDPVKDISITEQTKIEEIFSQMANSGGFEARNLAEGLEILAAMIQDKDCLKFLSFVGAIVSTGNRGIIKDMIKREWFDVVLTTCGALDHDIARHFSHYKQGSFTMDDAQLADQNIHRLGNVLVPMESYGPLIEEKVQHILEDAYKEGRKEMSTAQITAEIGKRLGDDSFLYWAQKNNIPVIVPGIMDGAVGSQVWMFAQNHPDFKLNMIEDANFLSGLIFKAKKSGALMLGGGISKHHTLWWNQYRDGLDYAVYLTTAQEFDGSLSGALVREAISWGKVTQSAKQTTIHAEITTMLPFLYRALLAKIT